MVERFGVLSSHFRHAYGGRIWSQSDQNATGSMVERFGVGAANSAHNESTYIRAASAPGSVACNLSLWWKDLESRGAEPDSLDSGTIGTQKADSETTQWWNGSDLVARFLSEGMVEDFGLKDARHHDDDSGRVDRPWHAGTVMVE